MPEAKILVEAFRLAGRGLRGSGVLSSSSVNDGYFADQFRIGQIISVSFEIYKDNFSRFTLFALLVYMPSLIFEYNYSAKMELENQNLYLLITIFLEMVLMSMGAAVIAYEAFQYLRGTPSTIRQGVSVLVERLLVLFVLCVFQAVCFIVGFLALVVPAIFFVTIWYVTAPSCLVEKRGVMESLRRSQYLTKGFRWKIAGFFLFLMTIHILVTSIQMGLGALFIEGWSVDGPTSTFEYLYDMVTTSVSIAFSSVAVAVIYFQLRHIKEGIDAGAVASVFE